MPVEIRETVVTPADDDHDVIQLYISDAVRGDEAATFVVQIHTKQRAMAAPALAQIQRAAMKTAQDELTPLLQALAKELQENGLGLYPPPKNRKS